ncbi:MAG: hypothetical protein CMN75_01080 [Spirochaeta sp.]|nr:hypothetical protein [Spirochaeta sp.]
MGSTPSRFFYYFLYYFLKRNSTPLTLRLLERHPLRSPLHSASIRFFQPTAELHPAPLDKNRHLKTTPFGAEGN